MRGRTALYGRRHLAQLVAIKRLQSLGKPLGEIQQLLPTLDDATLSRVSGVVVAGAVRERPAAAAFWKHEPVDEPAPAAAPAPEPTPAGVIHWSLPLGSGVTLTVTPGRAPTDADAETLRRAAAPLLAELKRRGLTISNQPEAPEENEEEDDR